MTRGVFVTGGGRNGDDLLAMIKDERDAMGFNLEAELKMRSPVDTGRLRGGFAYDPVTGEVTNNVEYVEAVNDLHPTAAGFIDASIDTVVRR